MNRPSSIQGPLKCTRRILSFDNHAFALIVRLLIIMLIFTVQRLLFLIFNYSYFSEASGFELVRIFLAGLRFDAAVLVQLNSLFIVLSLVPFTFRDNRLYRKFAEILFYLVNSIAFGANCGDFIYFKYTFKRTTADIFDYIAIGNDATNLLPQFIKDFWYVFVIWAVLIVSIIILFRLSKPSNPVVIKPFWKYLLVNTLVLGIFVVFGFIIGRGGFQLRPLSIITAGEYTTAENVPLVLNTPFSIVNTINKQNLKPVKWFDDNKCNSIFDPVYHSRLHEDDTLKSYNVMLIILEGFSKEHFACMNKDMEDGNYKGYSPFLDSLANSSLVFTNAFANGKKTIEGIPAIVAGIPTLMNTAYISSVYAGNNIRGLPGVLKRYGYSSAFYHGGTNGTMRLDAFSSMAGFDSYYGRTEYNNEADFDGNWGIWDEPYLSYVADECNSIPEPFLVSVFTLSSHHPYSIPEKYKGRFPKGRSIIDESIGYTDHALNLFFRKVSAMPWFHRTLFVITADHSSNTWYPYYKNAAGMYSIPLMYYFPGSGPIGFDSTITQQTDIFPTVLDYLNIPDTVIAFGSSALDPGAPHFAISYLNGIYQLIKDGFLLQFDGETKLSLYNIESDPLLEHNLIDKDKNAEDQAIEFLKAVVQSYNFRLINNKMIAK